jgi:hypothetical protein
MIARYELFVMVCLLVTPPTGADDPKDELKKWQGSWADVT